jgi:hypothetical protein
MADVLKFDVLVVQVVPSVEVMISPPLKKVPPAATHRLFPKARESTLLMLDVRVVQVVPSVEVRIPPR